MNQKKLFTTNKNLELVHDKLIINLSYGITRTFLKTFLSQISSFLTLSISDSDKETQQHHCICYCIQ